MCETKRHVTKDIKHQSKKKETNFISTYNNHIIKYL